MVHFCVATSAKNRLAIMLEDTLRTMEFVRDKQRLANLGEIRLEGKD